jgi:mono/diheme cytochrome c family protein
MMFKKQFHPSLRDLFHWVFAAVLAASSASSLRAADASSEIQFNRDVRPILSDNCFRCHGPEVKSRKGKLRLDVREAAVEREAIIPGNPDESEIIRRLISTDEDDQMPPPDTHKVVTPAQIETLRKWISQGAVYEPHWSYAPITRPALPAVQNTTWGRSTVDAFILQRLEAQGISPSPTADRRTLLRRLSLDLTGLPPTPSEVEAFVKDRSPKAVEKQVERLLASLHYGERMAVPWLDAVRFADTVGYHGDQNQNIFPYRDYVIDSFNANKRFDQFTVEQIAGDLLPNATVEQKIATGFNRLNMMTREGGAQPKEYLAKYQADRVRTVSTAWLGSTIACAECHDHKYDPFTAKDFYSLAAFFGDVKQWGVYQDYNYTPNPELSGWSNDHPFPPEIEVTNRFLVKVDKQRRQTYSVYLSGLSRMTNAGMKAEFLAWQKAVLPPLTKSSNAWQIAYSPEVSMQKTNSKTTLRAQEDGSVLCMGKASGDDKYKISLARPGLVSAIRLELLPATEHSGKAMRTTNYLAKIQFSAEVQRVKGRKEKCNIKNSAATTFTANYVNGHLMQGVTPEWQFKTADTREPQHAIFVLNPPMFVGPGEVLNIEIKSSHLGRFRIATSPLADVEPLQSGEITQLRKALKKSGWRRSQADRELLTATWLMSTTNHAAEAKALIDLKNKTLEYRNGVTPTLVTVATTNRLVSRVLPRGNWQDESGEPLAPAVPHFLPQPNALGTNPLSRLDLAGWLTSRENPLTARTYVNRLWKQFFGNGLSNQPEELGAQGEWPSHPELLDWLADEFIASGWDVKHMVRLMVNSATYQQDSKGRPDLTDIDPRNRLLAFQNPRRLEAEFIRDNALAIAGLINLDVGGPSIFPYQPEGYYANIQFPDRDYFASLGEAQYRRGLYMHWQRTFLHPMLANFDAPAREECTVDRPASTTPQQALTLLNDPTFVEAARVFAEHILAEQKLKTDSARLELALRKALLRPAKPVEIQSLESFLAEQRGFFVKNIAEAEKLVRPGNRPLTSGLDKTELAAWTSAMRVILNLHETITRY